MKLNELDEIDVGEINITKWKVFKYLIVFILVITALGFGGRMLNLGYMKFFKPKIENIEREVFENTKSYTHGKAMDLAKYYEEYRNAGPDEQEAIRQLIVMNFASFDEKKLVNGALQQFLINQRGY